jgi:hypothetical protein
VECRVKNALLSGCCMLHGMDDTVMKSRMGSLGAG